MSYEQVPLKCPEKVKGLQPTFFILHLLSTWNALKKWRDCNPPSILASLATFTLLKCPEKVKGLQLLQIYLRIRHRDTWNALKKWRDCNLQSLPSVRVLCRLEMPWKSEGIATRTFQIHLFTSITWNALKKWRDCNQTRIFFCFLCWLEMPWKSEGIATVKARRGSSVPRWTWNALKKWRDCNFLRTEVIARAKKTWNALKKWRDFNLNHQFRSFKGWKAILIRQKVTLKLLFCFVQTVITTMLFQGSITHLEAWPLL